MHHKFQILKFYILRCTSNILVSDPRPPENIDRVQKSSVASWEPILSPTPSPLSASPATISPQNTHSDWEPLLGRGAAVFVVMWAMPTQAGPFVRFSWALSHNFLRVISSNGIICSYSQLAFTHTGCPEPPSAHHSDAAAPGFPVP